MRWGGTAETPVDWEYYDFSAFCNYFIIFEGKMLESIETAPTPPKSPLPFKAALFPAR